MDRDAMSAVGSGSAVPHPADVARIAIPAEDKQWIHSRALRFAQPGCPDRAATRTSRDVGAVFVFERSPLC
jgi:hypothetical protein